MFALGFNAPSCPRFPEAQAPHTTVHAIKEKLHVIFISLTTLGLHIAREGRHDQARWILMKLLLALEKYPGLYDSRKRDALLKIANFFQRIEDRFEYEYVLEKVASLYTPSPSMTQQDNTCSLLAQSYVDTSDRIYGVLADLWPEAFGIDDDLPSDLAVAPQQRALQVRNIAVASELWSHLKTVPPRLSLFNQQALHIAANYGMLNVVKDLIEGGADIEARDKRHRTPLFLAVLNGHAPCCLALLLSNADYQSRDGHGHTMIEVLKSLSTLSPSKLMLTHTLCGAARPHCKLPRRVRVCVLTSSSIFLNTVPMLLLEDLAIARPLSILQRREVWLM